MLPTVYTIQAQGLTNITEYKLDNGLTVILNPDETKAEVFGCIVCKAGSKDDPTDGTGVAHYMEHMLFKGTEELGTTNWSKEKVHIDSIFVLYDQLSVTKDETERMAIHQLINEQSIKSNKYAIPNELSKLIKQIGGTEMNANTSPDRTVYFNSFPPNQIESWLEIYSHRFQNAVFRSFQAELEVIYEEKKMYSDQFLFNMTENLKHDFFKIHPYGQKSLIGSVEDLKNPSLTKMKEFYETWYVPNNMALVLSGDFDSETIKPYIEAKFSSWEAKQLPKRKTWNEVPFKGRELKKVKMSPIKLGFLAYRTVPKGHKDALTIEICDGILANESQSGLMNQLTLENKVLATRIFEFPYYDYGLSALLVVPKIVGQSLEEAEQLVLEKIQLLKEGQFEDWRMHAIKIEMYRQHMESLESNKERGLIISETFARGGSINDIAKYPEHIQSISKEDVITVANKYYGDNYLAFFSRIGSSNSEQIKSLNYTPNISNTSAKSVFAQKMEEIKKSVYTPHYLDFKNDITKEYLAENAELYTTNNPQNDIFTLSIKCNVGSLELPLIENAAFIMKDIYTDKYSKSELKDEFAKLGAKYNFYGDESYTIVDIKGIDENFESTLKLLNTMLVNPKLSQEDVNTLTYEIKADRKMEREDLLDVSDAALAWVKHGKNSDYINRPTIKEIKHLQAEDFLAEYQKATHYGVEIHYTGQLDSKTVKDIITKNLTIQDKLERGIGPIDKELINYNENIVYFVNKKGASQAEIDFFVNAKAYKTSEIPIKQAFNQYFGGGFTGLLLQEIREYRSLAYSANAGFAITKNAGAPSYFSGHIGCQADNAPETIEIFHNLVNDMPHKTERLEMIRSYLEQSSFTAHPNFRGLSEYIAELSHKGIYEDPAKLFNESYKNLECEEIIKFYETNLKGAPMVTLVVGDKKKIDMDALGKYGKIIIIKEKHLYSK